MAYDNVRSDTSIASRIINIETVCNNFDSGNLQHAEWNLHIMCGALQPISRAVLDLVIPKFGYVRIYINTLYHSTSVSNVPQSC